MEDFQVFFDSYMKDMRTKYTLHDGTLIIQDYKDENDIVKEYEGREVFELLQNADDAARGRKVENKKVSFCFNENSLTISNNGRPFSIEGYRSILFRGLSGKINEEGLIGEKGLGFRSLLNWAKEIVIISNGFKVEFSDKIGRDFLKELFKDEKNAGLEQSYKKECRKQKLSGNVIAKLVVPSYGRFSETTDYDTIIQIKFEDDNEKSISRKINEGLRKITKETMLFMNNIDCIEIKTPDYYRTLQRKKGKNKTIIVSEARADGTADNMKWHVNTKEGVWGDKKHKLSVAWNDNLDDDEYFLYSFFKTEERLPLPAIVHGTFDLTPNRNRLQDTERNRYLIRELADLLVDTAVLLAQKDCSYTPLKFLEFVEPNLGYELEKMDFKSLLDEKRKNSKLFPTVNGDYMQISDSMYYHDIRLTELLKGDDVDILLQYCSDTSIYENRIKNNGLVYKPTYFAKILNKRMVQIETFGYDNYAYLLKSYLEYNRSNKLAFDEPLFIDENNDPISWNKSILISDEKYAIQYPKELPIRFINKSLVQSLRKVFNVSADEKLIEKLSQLKVKKFSPFEIMLEISKYYSNVDVTKENVLKCHKYLFPLYLKYRSEIKDEKLPCVMKVITTTGLIGDAEKVYFGADYGCDITEHLYGFDKSLIIGSVAVNGLENEKVETVKDYFKWLGVAEFPRIVYVDYGYQAPHYYMDYLFEKWNYDSFFTIEDYTIHNFDEYRNEFRGFKECHVQSVDKLNYILKSANAEYIIAWIKQDRNFKTRLEADWEEKGSFIALSKTYRQNLRYKRNSLCNHLHWLFSTTPWLKTKSNKGAAPDRCTLSRTITDDFSPLIEKPFINENAPILRKYNIKQREIESILRLVGVADSISDFSTNVVYSVLNELPKIDPKGEKAKSIYRELAANYDESKINKSNEQYAEYMRNGLVFCKNGSYVRYKDVYYLPNKRLGEAVVNQFNVVAIDTRKSVKRIANVFGIKELKIKSFSLVGKPCLHPLNSVFEKEIEAFKPYVYMFRKDTDQNGDDKKTLIDVKFRAVSKLDFKINKDGTWKEASLREYEYCYYEAKQCVYVMIPSGIADYNSIRDKVQLGTAVAEAFSNLFDVETIDGLRELFGKTDSGRQDIIRNDLDDTDLSRFYAVEKELGMTHDYKLNFWKSFLECFPSKEELKDVEYSDETLLTALKELFPECDEMIEQVFNSISNYADYAADNESTSLLVDLLRKCNVTLLEFNKFVYPELTLDRLYRSELGIVKSKRKELFESRLYQKLNDKSLSEQRKFCGYKDKYDRILGTVPATLDFDVEKDFKDEVVRMFDIQLDSEGELCDLVRIYNVNKQRLIQETNKSGTFIDEFLEEKDNDSLLYFESGVEELIRVLHQMDAEKDAAGEELHSLSIGIGKTSVNGNSFKELCDEFDNKCPMPNVKSITIKTSKLEDYGSDIKKGQELPVGGGSARVKKNTGEYGGLGEWFVYQYLEANKKQNEVISWDSDYARKYGCNPDGKDGLGYDICIKKDGRIIRYIEVKVLLSNYDAFHISRNEVEFGQNSENRDKYYIYIVRNLKQGNPQIEIMETPLKFHRDESFMNNNRFSVINDSYIIRYKRE